jgi:hypothetical protein
MLKMVRSRWGTAIGVERFLLIGILGSETVFLISCWFGAWLGARVTSFRPVASGRQQRDF